MTAIAHHPAPVVTALADARSSLASVVDSLVWTLDPAETVAALDAALTSLGLSSPY